MRKYQILAVCDPYNSRFHYRDGQKVLKMDGASPTKWVMEDGLTLEEARDILDSYANELVDVSYEDEESIALLKKELENLDEADPDFSWFNGAGWYINNYCVYRRGQDSLSDDVMTYFIEEV